MDRYLLFHVKMEGFLSDSATYTSDWREAKQVDYDTAIQYCRRYYVKDGFGEGFLQLVPIKFDDVRKITND